MCEANAYFANGEKEELYLENVDRVYFEDGQLVLENIFGHKKMINAKIKELALVDHKIILEK